MAPYSSLVLHQHVVFEITTIQIFHKEKSALVLTAASNKVESINLIEQILPSVLFYGRMTQFYTIFLTLRVV